MHLRTLVRGLLVVCVLLGANPQAFAQQPTLEEFQMLQNRLIQQEQRLNALESNGPYYNVEARSNIEHRLNELESNFNKGEPALDKPTQKWSGRVHFDYWPFPTQSQLGNQLEEGNSTVGPRDFVGFRRLRFGTAGNVTATMNYKVEMEFAAPGNADGLGLAFKDAYLGWTELAFFRTVLLGNQKRPYGLDHINSSRYNVFMERPFVVEAFNQDARRFGLASYGVSDNQAWNWRYGLYLMDDLQNVGFQRTDNYQPEFTGRLANTIWYDESSGGRGYAHWAVAGTAAFPGDGGDGRFRTRPEARTRNRYIDTGNPSVGRWQSYQMLGLEGVVNVGALSVVGEYQTSRVQRSVGSDLEFGGGYVYVAYFLTGEHTPWSRKSGALGRTKPFENFFLVNRCGGGKAYGTGAWQVAARYSHGDFTDDDVFGGVGNSFTLGLNWWWNPYARVQFNYIYGELDERFAPGAPLRSGDYNIFGTRFMVDF